MSYFLNGKLLFWKSFLVSFPVLNFFVSFSFSFPYCFSFTVPDPFVSIPVNDVKLFSVMTF